MAPMASHRILSLSGILLSLCGTAYSAQQPDQHKQLQNDFTAAATEFQVPLRLLQSIAYEESHWAQRVPTEGADESEAPPAYGVMGLRDDSWFGKDLEEAARLIGKSKQDLIVDSTSNIRGAAAYLHELATQENAQGAGIEFGNQKVDSGDLLEWLPVLEKYSGIPQKAQAQAYAVEVLKLARSGYDDNGIVILRSSVSSSESSLSALLNVPAEESQGGAEYPEANWIPSPNFDNQNIQPRYIVIHVTEGPFASAVSWLTNPVSKVSAHYVVRNSDGHIDQLVKEQNKAWHVRCWNDLAIGVEHEGYAETGDFSKTMYSSSSKLVRYLAEKYDIPMDSDHIIGHNFWQTPAFQKQSVLGVCNDHTDPGALWDWTGYFALLNPQS